MAGLVPAIHVFGSAKTWMPGIKPGMTAGKSGYRPKIVPAIARGSRFGQVPASAA
jgi:hypothetical protein